MKLTGPQAQQFSEALRAAFDRQSLAEMLRFNLNMDLANISLASNMREIVFDLIRKAEQEGWTDQLLVAARNANPGNQQLRAFAEQVQPATGASTPKTDAGATGAGQGDDATALRELIRAKKRRRAALELRAAQYGINAPPEVSLEIEDLNGEIPKLERQLSDLIGS